MPTQLNWAEAWSNSADLGLAALDYGGVNAAAQVQTVTVGNGIGNAVGDITTVGHTEGFEFSRGDVNVTTQVQAITAGNGVGNDIGNVTTLGNAGLVTSDDDLNGANVAVEVDTSNGVNVDVAVQTFAIGNGVDNTVGGEPAGDYMPFDGLLAL